MAEASTQRRKRKLEPRSGVWEHFNRFTDDHGNDKAECKSCRLVLSANTKNGTSSLQSHVRICKCKKQEGAAASSRSDPSSDREPASQEEAGRETSLEEQASGDLARMIALHGYDSSVVEDDFFRSFVRRLNPEFRMPSRSAIEEMCDGIFDEARTDLFSRLRRSHGRVSLAVGRAQTMEWKVLYTACHFIDDEWNLHKVVMDAYVHAPRLDFYGPLSGVPEVSLHPDACEDYYIRSIDRVIDGISGRGILDRLFMMARGKMDGSIHRQLMDCIEEKFPNAYPRRRELISTTYMDEVLHYIARCLARELEYDLEMCSGVQDLHVTRQKRQQLLSQHGLDYLWAYGEDWYASYCTLEVLLDESSAIEHAEISHLLYDVWEKIYRAIKKISASSCPTSNLCLAELFNVREVLQHRLKWIAGDNANVSINRQRLDVVVVLEYAMDTLDRSLKETYLVWSIPLVLDPRYKLGYIEFAFRRAFGSDEAASYISEVTEQIKKLYADYTECDGGINGADSSLVVAAGDSADPSEQAWDGCCRSQTELDRYLRNSPVPPTTKGFDILSWWKDHSREYPTVARMARDALAMPTCSKLSSEQLTHVRSIILGYSKEEYRHPLLKEREKSRYDSSSDSSSDV